MFGLLDLFDLDDALRKFECLDLRDACLSLLQALEYSFSNNDDFTDESVENFIYFTVPNKVHFSSQEMFYIKQINKINLLCELTQHDLIGNGYSDKSLVFIVVELNCNKSDRSENSHYITQILNKLYNDYIFVIFKHKDSIEFCTFINNSLVYMSDWFDVINPTHEMIYKLLEVSPTFITGITTLKEFYEEVSFGFAREYIKRPESFEYMVYEHFPSISDETGEETISKKSIDEFAEKSKNHYRDLYGDDYVIIDENFAVMKDNEEDWTLFEFDDFISPEAQVELNQEFIIEEYEEESSIDFSEVDEETLNNPVKLLKWIEERENKSNEP